MKSILSNERFEESYRYKDPFCREALEPLRDKVGDIDYQILRLISKRLDSCTAIGLIKFKKKKPICNPVQEKKVYQTRVKIGKALGLKSDFVKEVMTLLMKYSKEVQRKNIEKKERRNLKCRYFQLSVG